MNPLHTFVPIDIVGSEKMRWAVLDVSHTFLRANGDEGVIPKEVWSTGVVDFNDPDEVNRTRRQAFDECCRRNGGKPRPATFQEALVLKAQLRALDRQGVRP